MKKLFMLLTATMMSLSVFIGSTQLALASSLDEATIKKVGDEVSASENLWKVIWNPFM